MDRVASTYSPRPGFAGDLLGQYDGAGARLRGGPAKSTSVAEALGRSCGGFSTKIHALTDALGNPLDFVLTGGQAADITQAEALLPDEPMGAVVADKGYDANDRHRLGRVRPACRRPLWLPGDDHDHLPMAIRT